MSHNLSRAALLVAVAAAVAAATACGESPEVRRAEAIKAVSAESASAAVVQSRPLSGLWDVDRASERLVRAGVAPRRITPTPETPAFLASATESAAFHVGRNGEVRVFVFADSTARSRVTNTLNEKTGAPLTGLFSWGDRPFLIVVQNMAAVMISGTDALRERVQLALEAGLPMPAKQE